MSSLMVANSYGKSHVHLVQVSPQDGTLCQIMVSVELTGDFANVYLLGDTERLIPAETIEQAIYELASARALDSLEGFGHEIAQHFLGTYEHVSAATVQLSQEVLLEVPSTNPASIVRRASGENRTTKVRASRGGVSTASSGFDGLAVIRWDGSDLSSSCGRLSNTTVDVEWDFYSNPFGGVDFNEAHRNVRRAVLEVFAAHNSPQIQPLLLAIGKAVVKETDDVKEVRVAMPNKRSLPHASSLGAPGKSAVFVMSESFGVSRCTVKRHHVELPVPFEWNDSFDVRHSVLNTQHAALFELIVALDGDRKSVEKLEAVVEHAKEHFRDEEQIFATMGFDQKKQKQHKEIHARFLDNVQVKQGKPVNDATIFFLKKWLVEHIMGADMQFARFLEKRAGNHPSRSRL